MKGFINNDRLGEIILQDVKWAYDFRQKREDDWKRFYRIYKNYINRSQYNFDANLAIPTAYSNIEVQTAFLIDMVFGSGDFVEVLGKTPQGQLSAHAIKELLNYHFRYSIRTYEDMEKYIRQLLIYGTSVYKVFWDYRKEWKTRYVPKYEGRDVQRYDPVDSNEVVSNNPAGRVIDIWNFGFDPHATGIENARYAYEDFWSDSHSIFD